MRSRLVLTLGLAAGMAWGQPALSPAARTRDILRLFLDRRLDAIYEHFAPEMKKALSPEAFRASSAQIQALGPLQRQDQPRVRAAGEMTVVTIPLHWQALALDFGVTWNRAGQIAGIWFTRPAPSISWQPPPYSRADAFTARDVVVGGDPWKLPGTLTLPKGSGPFPALVLVQGSGPHDRDETVGGAKVFRDLAEGLSSRGIAVLRYEKRTKVYPSQCAADANFTINQESVDDAVRAAALLRADKAIDPARIYVLGHSLGGYVMPRILKRDPKLAGGVILAGNARPLEDLILEQTVHLISLKTTVTSADEQHYNAIRQATERIRALQPGAQGPPILGMPVHYLLDLKGYNPAAESRQMTAPLLILQGERDYQVTMKDFDVWKSALAGRQNVVFRSFPKLNHLFEAGEGVSSPAEYDQPGHVDAAVIDTIATWIKPQRRGALGAPITPPVARGTSCLSG